MNIRGGDAQIVEEDVRHHGVVVLAGVDNHVLDVRLGGEGLRDRAQLDELRPGPDDAEYLHELVSFRDCRSQCASDYRTQCAQLMTRVVPVWQGLACACRALLRPKRRLRT